jgi:hypothetical protein
MAKRMRERRVEMRRMKRDWKKRWTLRVLSGDLWKGSFTLVKTVVTFMHRIQ